MCAPEAQGEQIEFSFGGSFEVLTPMSTSKIDISFTHLVIISDLLACLLHSCFATFLWQQQIRTLRWHSHSMQVELCLSWVVHFLQ